MRKIDVDITESPAEERNPSSALLVLGPSYSCTGSQQDSASAKDSVKETMLPAGASKVDGAQDQLLL